MCLPELEVPKIAQACDTLVLWKSKIALKQIINEFHFNHVQVLSGHAEGLGKCWYSHLSRIVRVLNATMSLKPKRFSFLGVEGGMEMDGVLSRKCHSMKFEAPWHFMA